LTGHYSKIIGFSSKKTSTINGLKLEIEKLGAAVTLILKDYIIAQSFKVCSQLTKRLTGLVTYKAVSAECI
jgi:hypothetical protein